MGDFERNDEQNEEEAKAAATALLQKWIKWAQFDLEHFLEPLAAATGLSQSEALLYLIGERLGQIVDGGLLMHIITHPPSDPEDEWKRGRP